MENSDIYKKKWCDTMIRRERKHRISRNGADAVFSFFKMLDKTVPKRYAKKAVLLAQSQAPLSFMFPTQAITIFDEINGSGSSLIYDDEPSTILGITISQENASGNGSYTELLCGNDTVAKNNTASKYFHAPLSFPCEEGISVENTAGGNVTFSVTIVPFLYSEQATSTEIATSSDISVVGTMSAGEVMLSLLVFILIVIELFKTLAQALRTVNKKRKQLAYAGGDVDINELP